MIKPRENGYGNARATLAAALILAVGMGFGRFSYTGMYPLMVRDGLLSVAAGSWAASANYAGYLAGALLLSRSPAARSARLGRVGLGATVVCLALLAAGSAPAWVILLRFVAGVASAFTMVAATAWLFQVVGNTGGAAGLYAGVGAGILLSAELVALGDHFGVASARLWLALAAAAALLSATPWRSLGAGARAAASGPPPPAQGSAAGEKSAANAAANTADAALEPLRAPVLIAVYGFAGLGYIVTATYLPLFVQHALGAVGTRPLAPIHVWAAFGLGAVPSCLAWQWLHRRMGTRNALALNLGVQAVGVVLPVLGHAPLAFMASALLVGATFMGTVTIAMPAARGIAARLRYNIFAAMTAAYGLGQIAGPLLSDLLYRRARSFDLPLLVAAAVLTLAALATIAAATVRQRPDCRTA